MACGSHEKYKGGEGESDNANVHGNGHVDLLEANVCTCKNQDNAIREKLIRIGEAFLTRTIELQVPFDKNHMLMGL
jgi:hypothetical protein